MTSQPLPQWRTVDEGWGRRAVDFATLLEPAACREYAAMHHHLGVGPGDDLLDVACGSGLALELAAIRGATVSGIDAAERLVAVARDRVPGGDVRVGDMTALPWADASFDVVTSFRGLWATTPAALAEARRVLRPGGRISVTTWGHVKVSSGFWALEPFGLAATEKVTAQAAMKSLGRPGVGEEVLAAAGFTGVRRHPVPFALEFPDPQCFARALAATGPAYEAIQEVGEEAFLAHCVALAEERVRAGLPLRAELDCVGFTAVVPGETGMLLAEAPVTEDTQPLVQEDLDDLGFLSNVTRLWMHDPGTQDALFAAITLSARHAGLSMAERGIVVVTATTAVGDTYCPLAWGGKLAGFASPDLAASVVRGSVDLLSPRETAIVGWVRQVVDPTPSTRVADLAALRAAGFADSEVLALTCFVMLRVAFSTVNGVLGALPEEAWVALVDPAVREAWTEVHGGRH